MIDKRLNKRGLEVTGVIITLFLLGGIRFLQEGIVKVLLQPYVGLCRIFYNVDFSYYRIYGYICSTVTFAITKECLGNTFMAMVFVLLFFRFKGCFVNQGKWLGLSLVLAVGIGYMMSSIRILASVPFTNSRFFGLIHGTIGIILYLGGLLAISGLGEWMMRKKGSR